MLPSALHLSQVAVGEASRREDDLVALLLEQVRQLGITVGFAQNTLSKHDLNVITGAVDRLDDEAISEIIDSRLPYVVCPTSPNVDGMTNGNNGEALAYHRLLRGAAQVWEFSPANVAPLQSLGVRDVQWLSLGYCASWERVVPAPTRDIDVLLPGEITPRRALLLERLRQRGHRVELPSEATPEKFEALLARARIVVCSRAQDVPVLDVPQLAFFLHNRCCVVAEESGDGLYPGLPIFAPFEQLPARVSALLQSGMEAERYRLGRSGYVQLRETQMLAPLQRALSTIAIESPSASSTSES